MTRRFLTIRRLLAGLEDCAAEETGLAEHEDWAGLAELFVRELALLHRLAHEKEAGGEPIEHDAGLMARVEAVKNRHARMHDRLIAGQVRLRTRLDELEQAGRRARAVRGTYQLHAA
jgi:hypothetical protein